MTQTTNYDLNIVEGTDVVNPLVQTNPNFNTIDTVMKANEGRGIATATEVKSGTNHAITRNVANAVFRFVATSDFRTGDTFSVDGTTVTATLADGSLPKDRAFVVGTSVECIIDGIRLTFVNCEGAPTNANAINYDNNESGLTANNVQSAIDELAGKSIPATKVTYDNTGSGLTANNVQSAISELANRGRYSVTSDGVKTNAVILNEIFSHIDISKVTKDSKFIVAGGVLSLSLKTNNQLRFIRTRCDTNDIYIEEFILSNSSVIYASTVGANSYSRIDDSGTVTYAGVTFELYY